MTDLNRRTTNELSPCVCELLDVLQRELTPSADLTRALNLQKAVELFEHLDCEGATLSQRAIADYLVGRHGWRPAQAERAVMVWATVVTLRAVQTNRVIRWFAGRELPSTRR